MNQNLSGVQILKSVPQVLTSDTRGIVTSRTQDNPFITNIVAWDTGLLTNVMKRDRDDTDFRGMSKLYERREKGCIFCELPADRIVAKNEQALVIRDGFPVTEGHSLIIPKRHVADYFELFQPEHNAIQLLMQQTRSNLLKEDPSIDGLNMGVNSGSATGQTVFHCQVHLMPRKMGDVGHARGGVRGVTPAKQDY